MEMCGFFKSMCKILPIIGHENGPGGSGRFNLLLLLLFSSFFLLLVNKMRSMMDDKNSNRERNNG